MDKNREVLCLLCNAAMELVLFPGTSYWQCQESPFHRMSLPEWNDLVRGKRSEKEIHSVMETREGVLKSSA